MVDMEGPWRLQAENRRASRQSSRLQRVFLDARPLGMVKGMDHALTVANIVSS
jgi:hypothetical protein